MGDQITIPRTFAGQLGVADALPSIRRSYIPLFDGAITTGVVWPGGAAGLGTTILPQNGINFLQRNFTVERAFLVACTLLSTSSHTTTLIVDIMGGGTTIARLQGRFWNDTTTPYAGIMSTTPLNANIGATTPIRVQVVQRMPNFGNSGSVFMVGRERVD